FILLTHRPDWTGWAAVAPPSVAELSIQTDDPEHQADLAAFLRQTDRPGATNHTVPGDDASPNSDLLNASQGSFRYLANQCARRMANPAKPASQPSQPPNGLTEYYDALWHRNVGQADSGPTSAHQRQLAGLIGLLSVAGEPVSVDWLAK